ncbi:MAG: CAP domain-containing protein [Cyanobacteria bacterium J06621_11]
MRKDSVRTRAGSKLKFKLSAALATFMLSSLGQLSVSLGTPSFASVNILRPTFVEFNAAQAQTTHQTSWASLEQEIISEHNRVRQNPQSYIPLLENYLESMTVDGHVIHGCGQGCLLTTREGRAAVEEAIAFLRNQPPVDPISLSAPVAQAAKSHAQDQQNGQVGHISSDGSSFLQRLPRFGVRSTNIGENISYGAASAQTVVMRLLIDDGVPSRGHRTNVFAPSWEKVGAGCGTHATYQTVCVINYATR